MNALTQSEQGVFRVSRSYLQTTTSTDKFHYDNDEDPLVSSNHYATPQRAHA